MKYRHSKNKLYMGRPFLVQGKARYLHLFFLVLSVFLTNVHAQTTVIGVVRDAEFHVGIPGAIVSEEYSDSQTTTNATGAFQLEVPTNTTLTFTIAHKGFQTRSFPVIASKRVVSIGEIELQSTELNFLEIHALANRAKRKSPVTHSNRNIEDLTSLRGLMQLPYSLQNVAGVYTSTMGNQFGSSRINIRGFDQQYISVNVNGIILNNPSSGDFSWAGRDDIQEMFSSIQVQKGTTSQLLYSPFIGGSLNILTKPASQRAGGSFSFEYGEGNFMRSAVTVHSGLLGEKFAVTLSGVRKTSDGIINGTWADMWAYYLASSYAVSEKHRLELYAMGAPQRHGQALNMQHVAAYSHNFAMKLGVPEEVLDAVPRSTDGRYFNQGIGLVDPGYSGQQYWNGRLHERYAPGYLNEHEHYAHAPLVQLNWYADWSAKISQQTMVYYSGLMEGNTGVSGSVNLDYTGPAPFIDYNSTIAENEFLSAAEGILNNSVTNQTLLGTMSRLTFHLTDQFNSTLGFNLKSAASAQFQEVRDLLGGDYFVFTGNPFDGQNDYEKAPGQIIGYHHTSQLRSADIFGNIQYAGKKIAAFLNGAYLFSDLIYTDRMRVDPDRPGKKYMLAPGVVPGFQVKSGLSYSPVDQVALYANYSYISRQPDHNLVISLLENATDESPINMVNMGFDAGARFLATPSTRIAINYYNYSMVNCTMTQRMTDQLSNTYLLHITGIDKVHSGVEFEAAFRPVRFIGLEANAAYGHWVFSDNATGILVSTGAGSMGTNSEYAFSNKNLKTGNAPQLQLGAALSVHPVMNSYLQASFRYYQNQFASWNPAANLEEPLNAGQLWEIPAYYLIDLHAGFTILTNSRYRIGLKGHVFNLLNEIYVQDALNNGALNELPGDSDNYINSASSASVYIGLPRTFSAGIQLTF